MPTLPISSWEDTKLVQNYLHTHDRACFDVLYERYAPKVRRKCVQLLKDETLVDDAVQETFIRIFLHLETYAHLSSFSTWVFSVTQFLCFDILRKHKRERAFVEEQPEYVHEDSGGFDRISHQHTHTDEVGEMEAYLQKMEAVHATLAPEDRDILRLKYIEELSIKDICTHLDKKESAVKMQLKRAKQRAYAAWQEFPPD